MNLAQDRDVAPSTLASTGSKLRDVAPTLLSRMKADMGGVHYAVRIFLGSSILWYLLQVLADTNPIWAISSMVAVTEGQVQLARANFRARIANTCIGGAVGLIFLLVAGPRHWVLPLALAITVLVSSYVLRVPTYWRIAPVTAALVVASSVQQHTRGGGLEAGLHRVGEVFLGSAMALIVAFVMAKIWPPPMPSK